MRIDPRYEGPPGLANGGVIAATLAGREPAEVTIRRPVPLGVELRIDGRRLRDADGELLAERAPLDETTTAELRDVLASAPRVPVAEAAAAAERTPLVEHHPFPTCFGCGPKHPDGLHCLAGPLRDDVWAVAFTAPRDTPEVAWAALDCASSAPHAGAPGAWTDGTALVLGRIAGLSARKLRAGEPHVAVAWAVGTEGRKLISVAAVLGGGGEPVAAARATWFAVPWP